MMTDNIDILTRFEMNFAGIIKVHDPSASIEVDNLCIVVVSFVPSIGEYLPDMFETHNVVFVTYLKDC